MRFLVGLRRPRRRGREVSEDFLYFIAFIQFSLSPLPYHGLNCLSYTLTGRATRAQML